MISPNRQSVARAFTLTELLVVMAVIVILAGITALSIRGIAKDARMASSVNAVMAALDNTRALAMKDNKLVALVFRPRKESEKKQYVEMVACAWTGETYAALLDGGSGQVDRFEPIPEVPPRPLPVGVKVAGPTFFNAYREPITNADDYWITQANLSAFGGSNAEFGGMVAVMFGPDGATRSGNSISDASAVFADLNHDGYVRSGGQDFPSTPGGFYETINLQEAADDEPLLQFAPYIAVYDDDHMRELRSQDWSDQNGYYELVGPDGLISQYADRIHFNRYTGVAMK